MCPERVDVISDFFQYCGQNIVYVTYNGLMKQAVSRRLVPLS
jgi:hypothetical protein